MQTKNIPIYCDFFSKMFNIHQQLFLFPPRDDVNDLYLDIVFIKDVYYGVYIKVFNLDILQLYFMQTPGNCLSSSGGMLPS